MKIEKLILIYQQLLPIYKRNEEITVTGLCNNASKFCNSRDLYNVFSSNGYYKNYIDKFNYRLNAPEPSTKEGKLFRINFMKNEIKELKQLLKNGYTEI